MYSSFLRSLLWASCVFLAACQSLPQTAHLPKSLALTQAAQSLHHAQKNSSTLSHTLDNQHANYPNLSGYHPVATGANAFAVRSILSDMATQTIDMQYYIWHNDEAGQLLLKDLWEAAERGVIVRLLLDDMNSSAEFDELLYRFAEHPNIAVRLMNPMAYRKFRPLNFLTHPWRTNARMHNKSMTIDNRISIIGGRNIGNEYLNNTDDSNFVDLDVLLVGSVVKDINHSFEEYWASPLAYDIQALISPDKRELRDFVSEAVFDDYLQSKLANSNERALRTYRTAIQNSTISEDLLNKKIAFRWTKMELFADPSDKLSDSKATANQHIASRLRAQLGQPHSHFSVISSYFVPTKDGVETLTKLAKSGVKVSILTNSFDATDVGIVHSGYAHWRKDLLQAGVNLFEIRAVSNEKDNKFWKDSNKSSTSLHAKAFAVDNAQVFIGSFNIDPRSANINTEVGVLIQDSRLATQFHHALSDKSTLINQAYQLKLGADGQIQWHTVENGEYKIYTTEPNTNLTDRAGTAVLGWLPIDWLL